MAVEVLERPSSYEHFAGDVLDDEARVAVDALEELWELPVAEEPRLLDSFNWELAERQLAEKAEEVRTTPAPESETYGRSLGTVRRLGAAILKNTLVDVTHLPEAEQAKVEFFTSVFEGFGTDWELGGGLEVRDFDEQLIINKKVMSKDGKTAITDMTAAGLRCAMETARKDRRFMPQLTRSIWDHENALIVNKMANGETSYNTRIVISPFPEEGAAESGDAYWRHIGYVPHLRRGFAQLYNTSKPGKVITGSLSFDGSNKHRLRELFKQLGVDIPIDEITDNWVKYAATYTMSEGQSKRFATAIADSAGSVRFKKNTNTADVTKRFRPVMDRVFYESYVHIGESLVRGRQTPGVTKLILQLANRAHEFNERYTRALYNMRSNPHQFTDQDSIVLHELLVYSTIEMMRALHLNSTAYCYASADKAAGSARTLTAYLEVADELQFQGMLSGFGADGARHNRIYSACGLELSVGQGEGADDLGLGIDPQLVFGGVDKRATNTSSDKDCSYISKACPMCGAKNVKTYDVRLQGDLRRISGACGCHKDYIKRSRSEFLLAA